jgi:hypothetical protein
MDIGGIAAGAGALKSIYDLISDLRKANDPATLKAGINEMSDRIFVLYENNFRLITENEALKAELNNIVTFEEQKKQYTRTQAPGGAFVYVENEPSEPNAPAPYFCPKCFTDKALSMLQPASGGKQECPNCKNSFQVEPAPRTRVYTDD